MLNLILSILLISPVYGDDASQPQGSTTYSTSTQAPNGPSTDYSYLNASLSDVNSVLNGGTSGQIREMAEKRSAALEDGLASAKETQAQAEQLKAQTQEMINAPVPSHPLPYIPTTEEFIKSLPARKVLDLSAIPDPEEASLPYQISSPEGDFKNDLSRLYKDLYKAEPQFKKQKFAKDLGLIAVEEADRSYSLHEETDAVFYKELAQELLDIVVGLDPISGLGRSAFELFMGRNLVTGATLTTVERSFAFLGIATAGGSKFITQAGRGIWKIYHGAAHLLKERGAVEVAIREGEVLAGKAGRLLDSWNKNHKITNIHTAEHVNQAYFPHWPETPPFELGSHVVEFITLRNSNWVRVHIGEGSQTGYWVMRKSAIQGLSPKEIAKKFNLGDRIPTHVSDVHIPERTTLFRGNVQDHGTGSGGDLQYWIKDRHNVTFSNMRQL